MLILIWPPLCRAVWVFSRYYHILDIKYLPVASAGKNRSGDGIRQGIFPVLNIACTLFAVCLQKALSFVKRAPLNVHLRRHRLTNVYRFIFLTSIDKSVTSDDHLSAVNCYGVKDIPGLSGDSMLSRNGFQLIIKPIIFIQSMQVLILHPSQPATGGLEGAIWPHSFRVLLSFTDSCVSVKHHKPSELKTGLVNRNCCPKDQCQNKLFPLFSPAFPPFLWLLMSS